MTTLKINTYISNYIPEFGYLSKESKKFIPIHHPDAKKAAEKYLEYENQIYLNGYIEIKYNDLTFLNDIEETGDLLSTWDDLAWLVINHEKVDEFEIILLDNSSTFKIIKDGTNDILILDSIHSGEHDGTSKVSIPSNELIEVIKTSFKDFVDFCNSGLVFNEESEYKNILESSSKI
ncbi:hypothetical protein NQZ71_20730 (plasmid) [Niallia taxi]|uniref:hypothetical protein n=1 Tax=Niallia taxi TaxID=2499688 RepID=UPI00293502A9|nr:hypothetical protein [Niallia taxi]WOD65643.1 hypothetical protein NQZ71_20730 [Niallia taxi]